MRFVYGFNPELVQALGYGKQIHNIINILHKRAQESKKLPVLKDAEELIETNFYLRYAAEQQLELLKKSALDCLKNYLIMWKEDFGLTVKSERAFELDVENALIAGSIDLLKWQKQEDPTVLEIVDFKTGKNRIESDEMDLQIRLYTHAAREALDLDVQKAYLHFLDDNSAFRREVSIHKGQLEDAMKTIGQAVKGVTSRSFNRNPKSRQVCKGCDWNAICPKRN